MRIVEIELSAVIVLIEAGLEGRILKCFASFCSAFSLSHPLNHEDNPVIEGEKAVAKQEPEVASKVCHKVIAVISQILKSSLLIYCVK